MKLSSSTARYRLEFRKDNALELDAARGAPRLRPSDDLLALKVQSGSLHIERGSSPFEKVCREAAQSGGFFCNTENAVSYGRPSTNLNSIHRARWRIERGRVGTVHHDSIADFLIALFDLSGLFKRDSNRGYLDMSATVLMDRSKVVTRLVPP